MTIFFKTPRISLNSGLLNDMVNIGFIDSEIISIAPQACSTFVLPTWSILDCLENQVELMAGYELPSTLTPNHFIHSQGPGRLWQHKSDFVASHFSRLLACYPRMNTGWPIRTLPLVKCGRRLFQFGPCLFCILHYTEPLTHGYGGDSCYYICREGGDDKS